MSSLERSLALHARVLDFAQRSLSEAPPPAGSFETLAHSIFEHQRLGGALRSAEARLEPTVVDVFRQRPVFTFDPDSAEVCFVTSGTTGPHSGRHLFRTTQTYQHLARLWGRRGLLPSKPTRAPRLLALMTKPAAVPSSSLAFMSADFMDHFDGQPGASGAAERWLLGPEGVRVAELERQVSVAFSAGQPVYLLATSFALVMLLDALAGRELPLPPGSVVMFTGGFKGRTREVPEHQLRAELARCFAGAALVGEYGMTELSSQLYEGTLPDGPLRGPAGVYFPPPWLRVVPLDPVTLSPTQPGQPGLASFIDLGNVDSCVWILTQDLVRAEGAGVRLLGRRARAPLRGCSLAAEALFDALVPVAASAQEEQPALGEGPVALEFAAPQRSASAVERVDALRRAAVRLQDQADPLGRRALELLPNSTGLGRQAVQWALSECLETDVDAAALEAFCERAPAAPRVWVVLSANVFVAAYRAIAWALAASERVFVKASRRDPVLAELLHVAEPGLFELVDTLQPRSGDWVHAYGSDETLEQLFAALPRGVTLLGYGSGLGAALVLQPGNEAAAAAGLAKDTVLFEQRGCLSPRCVGVSSACDVDAFVVALERELLALDERIPAQVLPGEQLADLAWYANLARQTGSLQVPARRGATEPAGRIHRVQQVPSSWPAPLLIAPPGRALSVFTADEPWLALEEHTPLLTCLGTDANLAQRAQLSARFPAARLCELGQMQRPPFDGPVDRRARPARTKL